MLQTLYGNLVDLVSVKQACDGWTPLLLAALKGHLEVVKFLVWIGCDKEAKHNDGSTLLHLASLNGHLEVVKYLR